MSILTAGPDNRPLITIRDWGLPKSEEILDSVKRAVRIAAEEAIEYALKERVGFSLETDRPLLARVYLPLTDDEVYDGPFWEVDLRQEFFHLISMYTASDGLFMAEDKPMMEEIRDQLAFIVQAFDKALER